MTNDIKEILVDDELIVRYKDNSFITYDTVGKDVLDYITNLQEENINIKQQLLENKISLKDVEYQEKLKYKSRIDKANEYINEEIIPFGNEWHWDNSALEDYIDNLLNILEGNDKNA